MNYIPTYEEQVAKVDKELANSHKLIQDKLLKYGVNTPNSSKTRKTSLLPKSLYKRLERLRSHRALAELDKIGEGNKRKTKRSKSRRRKTKTSKSRRRKPKRKHN